ncbi:NUDIX domain-containing protein [Streptosporangium sp. NPDC002524]|uniref:NUDIX hydrolase n=1 Tax=Streptosporangium sp. NPDC002524 TaxID=3154537 RepID=UPI0033259148
MTVNDKPDRARAHQDDRPLHSVSVGAAVIDAEGRFLAIKRRDNGRWQLPGGVVELDEGPLDAVRREVLEETGIHVEPIRLTGVYKNMTLGVVSLVFLCQAVAGQARATEEAAETAWLALDEVSTRMSEAFSIRLLDALRIADPAVRTHDGEHLLGLDSV